MAYLESMERQRSDGEEGRSGGIASWTGALGSGVALVSANLAAACCGLIPALGGLAGALGLGFLQYTHVQRPILYAASGLALAGIGLSTRHHRSRPPLALALLSVSAMLYPFHVAMDLVLFRILVFGGLGGLLLAAILNLVLVKRRSPRAAGQGPFPTARTRALGTQSQPARDRG